MKHFLLLIAFASLYTVVLFPFTSYMKSRPVVEKIGYIPDPAAMKLLSADQHQLAAASLVWNVISYYGGLMEQAKSREQFRPEFPAMQKMIETAAYLDPYNMDAYYFAQAMVWSTGQVTVTNRLLEYGMRYRTWDYYLPYFAGFNYAYFLKDYANAARNYRRVGELTGSDLAMTLAGRYLYESGRTDMAISYLTLMVKNAGNDAVKKALETRLNAFLSVRTIEQAVDVFAKKFHRRPKTIEDLMRNKILAEVPQDPYGGTFYIDEKGKVRSTSKFSFAPVKQRRRA